MGLVMENLKSEGLQDKGLESGHLGPILRAVNVSKSYPDGTGKTFYAVKEANLSVREHALTVIKGRSGSGNERISRYNRGHIKCHDCRRILNLF